MQKTLPILVVMAITLLAFESNAGPLKQSHISGEGWTALTLGDFVNVKITGADGHDLWGEVA